MATEKGNRRLLRAVLFTLGPVVVLATGGYFYAVSGRYVATENAYVKFDIIEVSADVSGRAVEVAVGDNQRVRRGDLLFRIDPEPFAIELARAEAEMAAVRNEVASLRAGYRQAALELKEAMESISFLQREFGRQKRLRAKGVASASKYDEAQYKLITARQRVEAVRERGNTILAELGGDIDASPDTHPLYLQVVATRDRARLDLEDTTVRASADGVVSNVRLQAGEHVEAAAPIFTLIRGSDPWIEVNLKETQLTYVRVGQPATLVLSTYPDIVWHARVESISPATGAEYALLPPQNATGNWVKVVQRIPVRLDIEQQPGRPPLRAGMTAEVSIDTGRETSFAGWLRSALAGAQDKAQDRE